MQFFRWGLGSSEIEARTYAAFSSRDYNGDLLGAPGAVPTLPSAVGLSEHFPIPGDQGTQSSWVDDQNLVDESNELNNVSFSWGTVSIGSSSFGAKNKLSNDSVVPSGKAYNGKTLPPRNTVLRKVRITTKQGGVVFNF